MRLLFVSNLYPPHELGGWEQQCQEVVEALQARGHVCHILTSRFGVRGQPAREESVTRALYLEADVYHYRPLDFFLRRPWQERANRRALRRALAEFRPDIVFIWGMWNLSQRLAWWTEQWMPGRVAYAIAGYWPIEPSCHEAYWRLWANRRWAEGVKSVIRRWALQALARESRGRRLELRHVCCVSEHVRHRLTEAGALRYDARVIYNGVDPQPFLAASADRPRSDGGLRLVYTGGLVTHKGVRTAVEALGLLLQAGEADGLSLTIVGGGHPEYETELRRRATALGIEQHVTFWGRVPRAEIASILAAHDVFLFTSEYEEPIARSVMEAMAAGLAVIGTAVGGQREMLVDGANALVYPAGDAAQLAQCIMRLKEDEVLRSRLAQAGREIVLERFTLARMVDEMERWLEGIIT